MKHSRSIRTEQSQAFTIVELLIVVVVIAILAAITIVSYNGITTRATETTLKSDLNTAAKQLGVAQVENGSYPNPNLPDEVKSSDNTTLEYTSNGQTFCLSAFPNSNSNISPFHITQNGTITEGACSGHTGGGSGSGGGEVATTMQTFTSSQCATLATFTGSNEEAIISLADNRGGTEQTYQVAKLADDNCWMLNNLKLGSTTSTITLTPSDSNVAANFTLPQVTIPGATSHDDPQVIGPVPSDTGQGATNYGYLYNWPAATAGETRTTMPAGSGNAPYSICPANWRLPTGGSTGEFAWLNAKMNNLDASAPSTSADTGFYQNWQYAGPFRGVFSGYWLGSFDGQGSSGYFWSGSAHASNANSAHSAYFLATYVYPGNYYNRYRGFGVRCLLN